MEREIWKRIPHSHYSASNLGRVKNADTGKVLKGSHVNICIRYQWATHNIGALVAMAFGLMEAGDKCKITHIDGDKNNNRLDNLRRVDYER